MKLRDVAIRFRPRPLAPLVGVPLDTQFACLDELRRELTASYPSVLADRLIAITRKHGLDRFPEGFLVNGGIDDRGPSGARAALRRIRRNTRGQEGDPHPLFSNEFYRLCNPDVAATSVPPWAHYQVFGRAENRSPHPLVDVSYLAAWFPETSRGSVFDEYLMSPQSWTADPGPYVDCRKFLLHGSWDGVTHPLVQIVGRHLTAPWIHQRLLLVDSDSGEPETARLTAIGYLLSRSTARSRLSHIEAWSTGASREPTLPATFTVVPGYFLGAEGRAIIAPSNSVVSPDSTFVSLPTEFVSVRSGTTVSAHALRFIDRPLDHTDLRALVRASEHDSSLAPFTAAQEVSLRALVAEENRPDVSVLSHGRQIRVLASAARFTELSTTTITPSWVPSPHAPATEVAIVLPRAEFVKAAPDGRLAAAISAGATLCLVEPRGVTDWLSVLKNKTIVACADSILPEVLVLVDRDRVFRLGADEVA